MAGAMARDFWLVVHDNPETLTFTIAVDEMRRLAEEGTVTYEDPALRRRYVTANVRVRLHQ